MTDSRLRLILQTLTNWMFGGVISAGWLMDKVSTETAIIPLLALAGLDVLGRRSEASSASKSHPPLPPPGPTAAALMMAMESFRAIIG